MIARAPQSHPFSSGTLALLVHVGFFTLLFFGVNWRATEPPGMVVDLWSDVPAQPQPMRAAPPLPPPEPAPKPEPGPAKKVEPKPAPPTPIQKTDIALKDKKHKEKEDKIKPIQPKVDQAKLEKEQREKDLQAIIEKQRLMQAAVNQHAQQQQAAANQAIIQKYAALTNAKILSNMNKTSCGTGKIELEFDIALLPTGQLRTNPILRRSSGIPACDKSVENAILKSDPLPVPSQSDIFSAHFREHHFKFRPND